MAAVKGGNKTKEKAEKATKRLAENRQRFTETAPMRTRAVLKALDVLGNCGNPSLYVYEQDEVDKILDRLAEGLNELRLRFRPPSKEERRSFEL